TVPMRILENRPTFANVVADTQMESPLVLERNTRDIDTIQGAFVDNDDRRTEYLRTDAPRCGTPVSLTSVNLDDGHQHAKSNQVLVELYDLELRTNDGEWLETARWIKYEEDVEGAGHHWGQPHVAFLSFHSLLQLRRCFIKGILLFDVKATSFSELCEEIGCAMALQGINDGYIKNTIRILQLKHLHPQASHLSRISTAANALFEKRSSAVMQHLTSSISATHIFENVIRSKKGSARRNIHEVQSSVHLGDVPLNHLRDKVDEQHQIKGHSFDGAEDPLVKHARVKLQPSEVVYGGDSLPRKVVTTIESAQVFAGIVPQLDRPCFVMVRLFDAQPMPEIVDGAALVRFVFVLLGPAVVDLSYYEMGRSISTLIADRSFNKIAYETSDRAQIIAGIDQFLNDLVVIPPGEITSKRLLSGDEIKKALKKRNKRKIMENQRAAAASLQKEYTTRSGSRSRLENRERKFRFFDGMIDDISKRLPYYWTDFSDSLRFQCLTSIVFMFFASFAPAITFGGLLGKYTDEKIGTMETLLAQSICGIIWGLFAAQPLLIMSATGPVLIFEASLYTFCVNLGLDFMTVRVYAGVWVMIIALVTVAFDGSRLLVYVTRFTEEIFASLISMIFIAESTNFAYQTFIDNPVEDYKYYRDIHLMCDNSLLLMSDNITNITVASSSCSDAEPNTALLTAIILFSTFALAYALRQLRQSFYLGRTLRHAIGDFGVLIAIAVVALTAHLLIPDTYLARLDMPDHINFTNLYARGHGLLISAYVPATQWWALLIALFAALLVFILLFVETEITELLLSRRDRGLVKGTGLHWDLVLMGICTLICSVFGLPWMCAAAVQSLAHCGSLTVMKKAAPGEKAEVDHVIEQRITTIGVSVLIGLITLAGSYLRLPLASLFGVFLYLGVMNLSGVQLFQRIILFFILPKYFPTTAYTETVPVWRMHLYTTIQTVCLLVVYTVKHYKETALSFPFVLMLFIFLRQCGLTKIFTVDELKALDGEEEPDDGEWIEKDFYENAPLPV
uniref:Anion exchange protein n=1 Tax=Parascaris univalens TaxID=6257 RepID=A0A914ZRX6_PARUN